MIRAIKYWWYRVWKYRKAKFKITLREEAYFEKGDILQQPNGAEILCIGKGYYITHGKKSSYCIELEDGEMYFPLNR